MDRNERILTSVLRERSHHRGGAAVRSEWFVFGAVLVVVAVAVGFQVAALQHAGVESRVADGAATRPPSTSSTPEAQVSTDAGRSPLTAPRVADVNVPTAPPPANAHLVHYIVQPGDSVQSIAARNHLRPSTLISVNELTDPDLLQPGHDLLIPSTDGILHIVEPGETLRSIADRYGSETAALIDANALSAPDHIAVGLRLFIPQARTVASATADR